MIDELDEFLENTHNPDDDEEPRCDIENVSMRSHAARWNSALITLTKV